MKENLKKIKKYVKLIKFAAAAATVAMAIYTIIPKNEKIKDIDTDVLIAAHTEVAEAAAE